MNCQAEDCHLMQRQAPSVGLQDELGGCGAGEGAYNVLVSLLQGGTVLSSLQGFL